MTTTDPLLIDFDAFRAEQQARPLIIRIGGQDYALPSSPPASVALDGIRLSRSGATTIPADDVAGLAEGLFGTAVLDELLRVHRLTVAELQALITPGHGHLRRRGQPTPKPGDPADAAPDPFDLMASWALVEADFMREYGIDLVTDLPRLTLRRFMVLVRGLGPAQRRRQPRVRAARHGRQRGVADGADAGGVRGSTRGLLRAPAGPGELTWRRGSRSARCTRRSRSTRASSRPTSRARRVASAASPSVAKKSALVIGAALLTAAAGVLAFGIASIDNAQEQERAWGRVTAVFGESGDAVNRWAEQSSRALGVTDDQLEMSVANFAEWAKNAGVSTDAATEAAQAMAVRASEISLATGKSYDEVFGALQKGAQGSLKGLKEFGVAIDTNAIRQQALTMGLWDGTGALDASAAAQARSALILAQTTAYQEQAATMTGTLADSQRKFGVVVDEVQDTVGAAFMNIAQVGPAGLPRRASPPCPTGSPRSSRPSRRPSVGSSTTRAAGWRSSPTQSSRHSAPRSRG